VKQSLDSDDDKIKEILKYRLPVEESKISCKKSGNSVVVTIPEEIFRMEGLQGMKHFVQMDIFKFAPSLEKINFIETHSNQKKASEKKPEPKKEKPVEQKTS
ncbi:MAG: peptidylprolyl isomerase, partial [Nitrosopumilaceae archaeon]|nr:peptidylprolyl isomerase [Nitrosopumilaceae archaeon]